MVKKTLPGFMVAVAPSRLVSVTVTGSLLFVITDVKMDFNL